MSVFWSSHVKIVISLGAGIAIGVTATVIGYKIGCKLHRELAALEARLESLRQDIQELKNAVDSRVSKKKRRAQGTGYYSVHASSGEEDTDIFEEALGGESEYESFSGAGSSFERESGDIKKREENGLAESSSFEHVDTLLEGSDSNKEEAYSILKQSEHQNQDNPEHKWRLARAIYHMSQIEGARGDDNKKKELVYKAKDLAFDSLDLTDDISSIHKWCAITLGSVTDYESTSSKIQSGYKIKEHIDKAIELNPKDTSSHYLRGRWCFGVYMLTWVERQLAATLFATPPTSTAEDALQSFLKAEDLNPGKWKENMLYIAKCYIEKRDYSSAVTWLDKANVVPTVGQDDRDAQGEVDNLLYKYSGYRK